MEQVAEIVRAQAALGTARLCPTLITAPSRDLRARRRGRSPRPATAFPTSPRGSPASTWKGRSSRSATATAGHTRVDAIRDPDWDEFQQLQEAAGRADRADHPRPGAARRDRVHPRRRSASGVVVALGHTAADGPTLRAAAAAGARLCTHLGNGIASPLPRHPNPIWEQAALDDLSRLVHRRRPPPRPRHAPRPASAPRGLARRSSSATPAPCRAAARPVRRVGRRPVGQDRRGGDTLPGRFEPGARHRPGQPPRGDRPGASEAIATVTRNPALAQSPAPAATGQPANLVVLRQAEDAGLHFDCLLKVRGSGHENQFQPPHFKAVVVLIY